MQAANDIEYMPMPHKNPQTRENPNTARNIKHPTSHIKIGKKCLQLPPKLLSHP
jgi:hypothetical protein